MHHSLILSNSIRCIRLLVWLIACLSIFPTSALSQSNALITTLDDVQKTTVERTQSARELLKLPFNDEIGAALARNIRIYDVPTWKDYWDVRCSPQDRSPVQKLVATTPEGIKLWVQCAIDSEGEDFILWANALKGLCFIGYDSTDLLTELAKTSAQQTNAAKISLLLRDAAHSGTAVAKTPEEIEALRDKIVADVAINAEKLKLQDPLPQNGTSVNRDAIKPDPNNPSSVEPSAPRKDPKVKPTTSTSIEEPGTSKPWSIIAVLIVAAIGPLWVLLKGRK